MCAEIFISSSEPLKSIKPRPQDLKAVNNWALTKTNHFAAVSFVSAAFTLMQKDSPEELIWSISHELKYFLLP